MVLPTQDWGSEQTLTTGSSVENILIMQLHGWQMIGKLVQPELVMLLYQLYLIKHIRLVQLGYLVKMGH